jgi:hypothetical protein
MAPDTTFNTNATFPGNGVTQGTGNPSVLYIEKGPAGAGCPTTATGCKATTRPAGNGLFFAFVPSAQANPNVFAFDETTGQPAWTAHLTNGGANAGNDGIRGTPAIDATSRRIFAVTGNGPHMVHAVSVDDGTEVTTGGWPVTLSNTTVSYGGTPFASGVQNQRGALLLVNNTLYIPFGGEDGDGGNYLGWVISIDITNPKTLGAWATAGTKSGIWASGGLAADGAGSVFAETGNGGPGHPGSDSEEVVRLTGMSAFTRSAANVFAANEWTAWDNGDLDFGSCSPAYVPLPAGSTPAAVLVAPAKAGVIYYLDGTNLSQGKYSPTTMVNMHGELAELTVSNPAAFSIYTSPTIYSTASGIHAAISVGEGAMNCPTAVAGKEVVVSTLIKPGATFSASVAWCAPGMGGQKYEFPPISTTSDGVSADPIVWYLAGGQLKGVNGDTGAAIVTTSGAGCNQIPSQSYPIAVKNRIVVFALGHLCSWSPGGM